MSNTQACMLCTQEAGLPERKNREALPIGAQGLQLPVVIAVRVRLVPHVDFIFQDFRQALRTCVFSCCYEVRHVSCRGPLFEIFIRVAQNLCRRVS